jgi:hypothetical protein
MAFGWRLPDFSPTDSSVLLGLSSEVNRQSEMIAYDVAFSYLCLVSLAMLPLLYFMRPAKHAHQAPLVDAPTH